MAKTNDDPNSSKAKTAGPMPQHKRMATDSASVDGKSDPYGTGETPKPTTKDRY